MIYNPPCLVLQLLMYMYLQQAEAKRNTATYCTTVKSDQEKKFDGKISPKLSLVLRCGTIRKNENRQAMKAQAKKESAFTKYVYQREFFYVLYLTQQVSVQKKKLIDQAISISLYKVYFFRQITTLIKERIYGFLFW